jgi:hypothetical protein
MVRIQDTTISENRKNGIELLNNYLGLIIKRTIIKENSDSGILVDQAF